MPTDDLLSYIFEAQHDALAEPFDAWLRESNRFRAFARLHRDKIRKKARGIRSAEQRVDLLCELETAFLLVQERRFAVEYERFNASKQRGPDFTVQFKSMLCNVEVTHIRAAEHAPRDASARLHDSVCDKLGQLQPTMVNVLLVVAEDAVAAELDVAAAMKALFIRASQKDDAFFARHGFGDARAWHGQSLRLSGVLLRPLRPAPNVPAALWLNGQARQPIPTVLHGVLLRAIGAS